MAKKLLAGDLLPAEKAQLFCRISQLDELKLMAFFFGEGEALEQSPASSRDIVLLEF